MALVDSISFDSFEGHEESEGESYGYESHQSVYSDEDSRYVENYSNIAKRAKDGTVPLDFLTFFHSYGYDCRRYFNLCVADPDTAIFASGNLLHFFNAKENKLWFRRGSAGGGIGHIAKNPVFGHIAVAENGDEPPITIYNWPAMNIITVLKGGTTKRYFHLAYSPDGLLLVSQGGKPDYFITVWNWRSSKIMLRCKSYVQDVYNVTFSKYIPGHISSCGSGHIKFWKMSKTFTGLKLKAESGRFGKTEISDIVAIYPMPNETVVSGCDWGNVLVWEESLIKVEVCRKDKQKMHAKCIMRFEYLNAELITVGMDGWIRFWFYETIDHAYLPDGEHFLEIQPIYEFHVTDEEGDSPKESAMLMCMQKQELDDLEKTTWYAQDGNGGLWLLDLCTTKKMEVQNKILVCHAGSIVDMDLAEWAPFIATLDETGHLHIYDYIEKKLYVIHKFYDAGRQVIWLPCKTEKTGSTLICGFGSGVIRLITVTVQEAQLNNNLKANYVSLIGVLKPHSSAITRMSINASASILVTGGEDCTVFAFHIKPTDTYPKIIPIGYVKVPSLVTCMTWNPYEDSTLLMGCEKGDCVEVQLPNEPQAYTTTSYELTNCNVATFKFKSIKPMIIMERWRQEQERLKEEALQKQQDTEKQMTENAHSNIDEEHLPSKQVEKTPLPEIVIPETPSAVLLAQYKNPEVVWLIMASFDAGYVYEYYNPLSGKLKQSKPIRYKPIDAEEDTEINSSLFYKNGKYVFLGTQEGEIRVCKIREEDPTDLSDYWTLPIHDRFNGRISKMILSYDGTMLLTCGYDGNIFAFYINDDTPSEIMDIPKAEPSLPLPPNVEDIEELNHPSLEEVLTRMVQNNIMLAGKKKKEVIVQIVGKLAAQYVEIVNRNRYLPVSQRIEKFALDPRITEDLEGTLEEQIALTRRRLAHDIAKSNLEYTKLMNHFVSPVTRLPFAVRCMTKKIAVHSLREEKLHIDSKVNQTVIHKDAEQQEKPIRSAFTHWSTLGKSGENEKTDEETDKADEPISQYLKTYLDEEDSAPLSGLGMQIKQSLLKYTERKAWLHQRENEWNALNSRKPNLPNSRKEDMALLEKTKETIGEYRLKSSPGLGITKDKKRDTALSKFKLLLNRRSDLHRLREDYNQSLRAMRERKQNLRDEIFKANETLRKIQMEIPATHTVILPLALTIDRDKEYPELNLQLEKYISLAEKMEQAKRDRQSLIIGQTFDPADVEYEVLVLDEMTDTGEEAESLSTLVSSSRMKIRNQSSMHTTTLKNLRGTDSVPTTWVKEMKRARIVRKIYQQNCILRKAKASYEQLEEELNYLEKLRINVLYQSIYMHLFILTLYDEFVILTECEITEETLEKKVSTKLKERDTVQVKIQATSNKIIAREEEIRKFQNKVKDLANQYTKAIGIDNKFQNFLQKIFKKKNAAAKKGNDSVDSDESSDTSSDESDSADDDKSDIRTIAFDENICPPGCDRELYEMGFSMREKRYVYEDNIKEEQRKMELFRKDYDAELKQLKIIENHLQSNVQSLQNFMVEKQHRLNDIDVTVVLKFHQLQHVLKSQDTTKVQDCVVFGTKELSDLYARIGVLQDETLELEHRCKNNVAHLRRTKYDCKYMDDHNRKLKEEIKDEMLKKFGRKISSMSLYEIVLQRMIYDIKSSTSEHTKDLDKRLKAIKENCDEAMIVLRNLIQDNSEKVSLLSILKREKSKLKKILKQSPVSEAQLLQVNMKYKEDLQKLMSIAWHQSQQKELLRFHIENLQTEGRLPSVDCKMPTI